MLVRRFKIQDASEISSLIRRSILNRNNIDYTVSQINSIAKYYSPENIMNDFDRKFIVVCLDKNKIVGTGTLFGDELMTLFIDPDYQKKGIGKKLMDILEEEAKKKGILRVWVVSTLTAVNFYRKLNYSFVKEKIHPEWGMGIVVEKYLR
ncbi:MAG: GNAT family N-acetyltransferase [Nanoarchaeota archaeon]